MEILKPHFSAEEIQKIQKLPDFAETKLKIEQMQADEMLNSLASRIGESIKTAKTLEEKWEAFKSSLEENPVVVENGDATSSSIDVSALSLEDLKIQAQEGIDGAKELLAQKQEELITAGEEKFKKGIQDSFLGKILPESLINWVTETGREKVEGKLEGIGGMFQGWILGIIVGFIPGGKLLMKGYEKYFGGDEEIVEGKGDEEDDPQETPEAGPDIPEIVAEGDNTIETEKIYKTQTAGYVFLGQLSGFPFEKNSPQIGILGKIEENNPSLSLIALKGYLAQGNLKESLNFEQNTKYSEEEIFQVVLGMVGPITEEFFTDKLSKTEIESIIGKEPDYTEISQDFFTKKERESIVSSGFQYEKLSLGILARLSIISIRKQVGILASLPNEYAKKLSSFYGEALKDEHIQDFIKSENEYPLGVSLAFESHLSENENHNVDFFISSAKKKLENQGKKLSLEDEKTIMEIHTYKETILSQIDKYDLETSGLVDNITSNIAWGDVLVLYGLMQGKDINNVDGFTQVLIYTWIYGVLDHDMKGKFQSQIITILLESKDENQSKVLNVLIMRIVEIDRNIWINSLEKVKGGIDNTVGWATGFNDIENVFWRNTLIGLTEVSGLTLAIKVLTKTPTFRAVLIATSGVVGTSLIIGVKEKIYQDQSSIVGKYYNDFLKELAPYMGKEYGSDYMQLVSDIEDGTLSAADIYKKVASAPEKAIASIVEKLFQDS